MEVNDEQLKLLDFYESEGYLYKRKVTEVHMDNGLTMEAWVYELMDGNFASTLPVIDSGEWKPKLYAI
jgi:gamma-glutamylcyclotransferase (GGCT)/AIG2-like uncharacterized protein YtfP